jgi:hypothetical protein
VGQGRLQAVREPGKAPYDTTSSLHDARHLSAVPHGSLALCLVWRHPRQRSPLHLQVAHVSATERKLCRQARVSLWRAHGHEGMALTRNDINININININIDHVCASTYLHIFSFRSFFVSIFFRSDFFPFRYFPFRFFVPIFLSFFRSDSEIIKKVHQNSSIDMVYFVFKYSRARARISHYVISSCHVMSCRHHHRHHAPAALPARARAAAAPRCVAA